MSVLSLDRYLSESSSFYIHRDEFGPQSRMKLHSHNFAEIFLVEKGRGHHRVNNKTFRLEEGMVCLVKDSDEHSLVSRRSMSILNIAFPPSFLKSLNHREGALFPLPESRIVATLEDEFRENFVSLSFGLSRGNHDPLDLEIFLLEFLRILRDGPLSVSRLDKEYNSTRLRHVPWMKEFNSMLNDPEELALNVGEIAERLGISREHLSREVRRIHGKGPSDMIAEARIRYACHLLRMSSLSIEEVSKKCGFSSPSRFYSRFRQIMGETPRHFREFRPGQ